MIIVTSKPPAALIVEEEKLCEWNTNSVCRVRAAGTECVGVFPCTILVCVCMCVCNCFVKLELMPRCICVSSLDFTQTFLLLFHASSLP